MADCAHLGCWADPCSAVRSCGWRVLRGRGGALSPHPGKSRDPRGERTTIGSAGPRGSPAAPGSASSAPGSRCPRLRCPLPGLGAGLLLPACTFRGSRWAALGLAPPASVYPLSTFFLSAPLPLLAAPHRSQPWGPSPSPPPGTGAQALGGRA